MSAERLQGCIQRISEWSIYSVSRGYLLFAPAQSALFQAAWIPEDEAGEEYEYEANSPPIFHQRYRCA